MTIEAAQIDGRPVTIRAAGMPPAADQADQDQADQCPVLEATAVFCGRRNW